MSRRAKPALVPPPTPALDHDADAWTTKPESTDVVDDYGSLDAQLAALDRASDADLDRVDTSEPAPEVFAPELVAANLRREITNWRWTASWSDPARLYASYVAEGDDKDQALLSLQETITVALAPREIIMSIADAFDPEERMRHLEAQALVAEAKHIEQGDLIAALHTELEQVAIAHMLQVETLERAIVTTREQAFREGALDKETDVASMTLWQLDRSIAPPMMVIASKTLGEAVLRAKELRPETDRDKIVAVRVMVPTFHV